jgi:hypothetical protein
MRLIALFLLAVSVWGACPNSSNGYSYCYPITIESDEVSGSGDHTNFPILVSLDEDWLETTGNGGRSESTGYDIRFETSGSVQLNHETEDYQGGAGEGILVAWVLWATLDFNDDETFYLYIGKSGVGDGDEEDAAAVWTDYEGVWHLSEDPSGSANIVDSTSNNANGTCSNMESGDLIAGAIHNGLDFDGNNDYCLLVEATNLSEFTVQVYANAAAPTVDDAAGALMRSDNYGNLWNHPSLPNFTNVWSIRISGTSRPMDAGADGGSWELLHYTNSSTDRRTYDDGVKVATDSTFKGAADSETDQVTLGANSSLTTLNWDGAVDEARVRGTQVSDDWVTTEYNNYNAPGTFLTVGAEDEPSAGVTPRRSVIMY